MFFQPCSLVSSFKHSRRPIQKSSLSTWWCKKFFEILLLTFIFQSRAHVSSILKFLPMEYRGDYFRNKRNGKCTATPTHIMLIFVSHLIKGFWRYFGAKLRNRTKVCPLNFLKYVSLTQINATSSSNKMKCGVDLNLRSFCKYIRRKTSRNPNKSVFSTMQSSQLI